VEIVAPGPSYEVGSQGDRGLSFEMGGSDPKNAFGSHDPGIRSLTEMRREG
jgi:hypothetical protein